MNKFRIPLLFTALIYVVYKLLSYCLEDRITPLLVFLIPLVLLTLNLILRKKLNYKNWFLSRWNILLDKKTFEFESDLSINLLLPKIKEIISDSDYQLLDKKESSYEFLLGTTVSFLTWGENIYIGLEAKDNTCMIKITSVTVFGSSSWGKNDAHFRNFREAFELSLTI